MNGRDVGGCDSASVIQEPSKPYIVVHLFSIVLYVQCVYHTVVHSILASFIIVTYLVANNSWCAV